MVTLTTYSCIQVMYCCDMLLTSFTLCKQTEVTKQQRTSSIAWPTQIMRTHMPLNTKSRGQTSFLVYHMPSYGKSKAHLSA